AIEDPDPYTAIMDELGRADYDEIIISTHPETRSGWLRRDLVQRVRQATRRPVEHVVVDHGDEAERGTATLVVANQTVEDQHLLVCARALRVAPRRSSWTRAQRDGQAG